MAKFPKITIDVDVDIEKIDRATEKANRLVELLKEAKQIIDSLSPKSNLTIDDVANAIVEGFKDSIHRDSNRIYNQPSEGMEPTLTKD